jgi:hypothetical protein
VARSHAGHILLRALICTFILGAAALVGIYFYAGWHGLNILLRRGGTIWSDVTPNDPILSPSMRLALGSQPPTATAGSLTWKEIAPGLEVGELPVLVTGKEVDRILLTRLEPSRFRIEVHNSPAGDKDLDGWMKTLGAVLVINGSYYDRDGTPSLPMVCGGVRRGPRTYAARHGAFVVHERSATIADLRFQPWETAFDGAHDALVSYPLLLARDGPRVAKETRWLANRSFVAQDADGRIIFGTTRDAFFSLYRLALFLERSPLRVALALNLDGGPVACQGVAINGFRRDFCGEWELQAEGRKLRLLRPLIGNRRWELPIVIAVVANRGASSHPQPQVHGPTGIAQRPG